MRTPQRAGSWMHWTRSSPRRVAPPSESTPPAHCRARCDARGVVTSVSLMGVVERVRNPILGVLVALHIHPNHITVVGAVVAGAAGYIVANGELVLAATVYAVGSALDGLDGALARRIGAASAFGAYLDSLLDRVGEGLILLGLLVYFLRQDHDLGAILSLTALLASLLVSYARARSEGLRLDASGGFAPRPIRIVILVIGFLAGQPIPALAAITALSTATVVQRTAAVWMQTRGGSA